MNIEQVKKDIEQWIVNFVEVPHPSLGGWPPCPYARRARLDKSYDVRVGGNPLDDLIDISLQGLGSYEVIMIAYDPKTWNHEQFSQLLETANTKYLLEKDIIVLEDHPEDVEIVNGVCMNQGMYALALVQNLSELNAKAKLVGKKKFYNLWPEDYLKELFHHRVDPRS